MQAPLKTRLILRKIAKILGVQQGIGISARARFGLHTSQGPFAPSITGLLHKVGSAFML